MMVREFQKRRDVIVARLNAIPGVTCLKPQGAFYVFPNVSYYYGRSFGGKTITNSAEMATYLLDESNVALVPGGISAMTTTSASPMPHRWDRLKKGWSGSGRRF